MTGPEDDLSIEKFKNWLDSDGVAEESARDLFRQRSHIALHLTYDLIDKLRWWEKETLKLSDEEIEERLRHMSAFLAQLKTAYLTFAEVDF